MATPTGTEIIQALGVDANSHPAAITTAYTLRQVAALNGTGSYRGTFVATGATAVTVTNTNVLITSPIVISLNTVGGTVGAHPVITTITSATGFTVTTSLGDTSTYNYAIFAS